MLCDGGGDGTTEKTQYLKSPPPSRISGCFLAPFCEELHGWRSCGKIFQLIARILKTKGSDEEKHIQTGLSIS